MKSKQIFPPTYLLASILTMLLLHFFLPVARIIAAPWNLLGIVILIAGVAINVGADNLFHRVRTTVRPFEESTTLVTTGLYRFSRNPMYLGFVLILISVAILCGSLTPFFVVALFAVLMDRGFIAREEKMLARKFGASWQKYEAMTKRWI
jgi:protein-S-isoprenylcysteine O-methyltransferase Ste14